MLISRFNDVLSPPAPLEMTWPAFADELAKRPVPVVTDKRQSSAFSPAAYRPGETRRSNATVQALSMAVLDVDGVDDAAVAELELVLEPYELLTYTTLSHPAKRAQGLWAFRVVLPLDRPVPAKDWPRFWGALHTMTRGHSDPACKDPSRLYLLPAHYPNDPPPEVHRQAGRVLTVAEVLAHAPKTATPPRAEPVVGQRVDNRKIYFRGQYLCKSEDPARRAIGENLRALARGMPYGAPGKRNATMLHLTREVERLFPHANTQDLADVFARSHAAMAATDAEAPDPLTLVKRALDGARNKRTARNEQAKAAAVTEQERRIAAARGDDETHPYTPAELEAMRAMHGLDAASLKHHWILRANGGVHLLTLQGYSHLLLPPAIVPTIAQYLCPAPVSLEGPTGFRSINNILRDYSTHIDRVVYDLRAAYSRYDPPTKTLYLATAPKTALEPKEHPKIQDWLERLGGDRREKFLAWLAACPDMTQKLCAIYLHGAQGVGKTVLAHGISKIWRRGSPTPFATAVGRFNFDLAQCPVVLVDEGFPALPPKQLAIELRTLVGGDEIRVEQKFGGSNTLIGPRRLIMCANNSSLLDFKSELQQDDVEALAVRILQIDPDTSARDCFRGLSASEYDAWKSHQIAEHVLYLNATMNVEHRAGDRFAVQGELDDGMRQVLVNGHFPSMACQAIIAHITSPQRRHDRHANGLIRVGNGKLLVNQAGLAEAWAEAFPRGPNAPAKLGAVLKSLSNRAESEILRVGATQKRFWSLDVDVLATWADHNGHVASDIRTLIDAPPSESRAVVAVA